VHALDSAEFLPSLGKVCKDLGLPVRTHLWARACTWAIVFRSSFKFLYAFVEFRVITNYMISCRACNSLPLCTDNVSTEYLRPGFSYPATSAYVRW
jgi:hypothetical protein